MTFWQRLRVGSQIAFVLLIALIGLLAVLRGKSRRPSRMSDEMLIEAFSGAKREDSWFIGN